MKNKNVTHKLVVEKIEYIKGLGVINNKNLISEVLLLTGGLIVISLLTSIFFSLEYRESFKLFFGLIIVFFLPGFVISYAFFPFSKRVDEDKNLENYEKKESAIDLVERTALSFVLSIAIVPLVVFYLSLIGVEISLLNLILEILGIIILSSIALKFRLDRLKGK